MTLEPSRLIKLHSGCIEITMSQSTGKIMRLGSIADNFLVEPKPTEWQLGLEPNPSDVFNSSVAWGSDECFPNVAASEVWGLRDHGRVWGLQPEIIHAQNDSCTAVWKVNQLQFKRVVRALSFPENAAVLGAFEFEMSYASSVPLTALSDQNSSNVHAAGLYAWHTLFQMTPNDVVSWGALPEVPDAIQLATGAWQIRSLASRAFAPEGQAIASKFYIETGSSGAFATSIVSKARKVRIDVIQDHTLPWVGVWWCHNGWGDGRPHSTVGIEPTNIPSDGPVLRFGSPVNTTPEVAKILLVVTSKP
jgi:hypothetical protein